MFSRTRFGMTVALLVIVALGIGRPAFALPTIREVARWQMWSDGGTPSVAIADTELYVERYSGANPSYGVYRCSRTTGHVLATFSVDKDTSGFWAVNWIGRFGMKGDTVATAYNYTTNHGGSQHALVRLYTRYGALVAQWPEKYFPRIVRGVVYSGGYIWVLHDGTAYGGGYGSPCTPPYLIRYNIDGSNPLSLPILSSSGGVCEGGMDLAADIGGGVVVLSTDGLGRKLRRYSPGGRVLADQTTSRSIVTVWEDHNGVLFGSDPANAQLAVYNLELVERGTIAGAGTSLGPYENATMYFAGDPYCRLYLDRVNEGNGDSLWVLSADPADGRSGDCWKPVLLVHGICGNAAGWDPFATVLADSGFDVQRIQYGNGQYSLRPAQYVGSLAAKLDLMGPQPIALVAHSMGGLIAREYMRRRLASGRPNPIAQLVTLGTPNHGSDILAQILGWGPTVDGLVSGVFGKCLGSKYSKRAMLDMVPAAWWLNRLNYGSQAAGSDPPGSSGWSTHEAETMLPTNLYIASIAGTGTFCDPASRAFFWRNGPGFHANDCTVATGSSVLANPTTFVAVDEDLDLEKPAAHTGLLTSPCAEPYYSFATLGKRVATILRESPGALPLLASRPRMAGRAALLATVEDSLVMAPPIADTVNSGQIEDRTVAVPVTSLVTFTLLSTDAQLSLVDPNGITIGPSDTSTVTGIAYYGSGDAGFGGFELKAPSPGLWTLRISTGASTAAQRVVEIVTYASDKKVALSVVNPLIHPGDSLRVRAEMDSGSGRRTDVVWTNTVVGPDSIARTLAFFDDGAHSDSLAGDGIYGCVIQPVGGVGEYIVVASASAGSVGPLAAVAYCELADVQDLAVEAEEIWLSLNTPEPGDSLQVHATVHNNSTAAAFGVPVEIRDLRTDTLLGAMNVDIAAGGAVAVQATWVPAVPDSHDIEVRVSPYVLDESNYANNSAVRTVVLGQPLSVARALNGQRSRFAPPYPNPSSRGAIFEFSVPRATPAMLEVFDIMGRRVQLWHWSVLSAGSHSVKWDGRDTSARPLAPGVYMCRLSVGDDKLKRTIILLH